MGAIVFEKAVKEDLNIGTGVVEVTNPGGGKITGHQINLASFAFASYSASLTPPTLGPGIVYGVDVTLPGILPGDFALGTFTGSGFLTEPSLIIRAVVVAADHLFVHIVNTGESTVNPGTGTLRALVFKTDL